MYEKILDPSLSPAVHRSGPGTIVTPKEEASTSSQKGENLDQLSSFLANTSEFFKPAPPGYEPPPRVLSYSEQIHEASVRIPRVFEPYESQMGSRFMTEEFGDQLPPITFGPVDFRPGAPPHLLKMIPNNTSALRARGRCRHQGHRLSAPRRPYPQTSGGTD
jgi:hypothetical protein